MTTDTVRRRYEALAPVYDRVTLDRLVYGSARRHAVALLRLRPGDTVLDVGCGTGLSLGLLRRAVGPEGTVIGLDLSAGMLRRARARVAVHGWTNVRLLEGDATRLPRAELSAAGPVAGLFALSLSAMESPQAALAAVADLLGPGGRVAVLDAGLPAAPTRNRLAAWALAPVWRGVCRLAAADPAAHPWEHVAGVAPRHAVAASHHLGFVRVAAGTVPPAA